MMKRATIAIALAALIVCSGVARAEEEFNRAKIEYIADQLQVAIGTDRQKSIEDMVRVGKACLPVVNAMLLEDDPQLASRIDGLIKQLGADEPAKRDEAYQALVTTGIKALPQIVAAEKDPDGEIAYRCINIQKQIEMTASQAVAMRTRQFTALIAVVKALHDPSSLKALEKCSEDTQVDIRTAAVEALAAFADPSTLDALSKRLQDENVHVHLLAGAGIIAISGDAARAKTLAMMLDPKENVYLRRQAILAFVASGDKKHIAEFVKILNDPAYVVRYAAFKGIQALGNTTETFGYDYLGDDEAAAAARAASIKQWEDWAAKNS